MAVVRLPKGKVYPIVLGDGGGQRDRALLGVDPIPLESSDLASALPLIHLNVARVGYSVVSRIAGTIFLKRMDCSAVN
jgi:hypothetical protein